MKILTYASERGPRLAALATSSVKATSSVNLSGGAGEAGIVDLNDADGQLPSCALTLLRGGPELMARAAAAAQSGRVLAMPEQLLPPVMQPEKIVCIGLNYADHARETNATPPQYPVIFNKFPTALVGHGQAVVHPRLSQRVDYEAELVVVIGKSGRHIPDSSALEHVAGYCCGNDISARDWQLNKPGGQWLSGKSFDTFAPCGPWMVTADEVGDPHALHIEMRLNGRVMQHSNTSQLIFAVEQLVSYISSVCTLHVGDLIYTGTPSGVGMARKPPVFLQVGDTVEVEIEQLGVLRNAIAAE